MCLQCSWELLEVFTAYLTTVSSPASLARIGCVLSMQSQEVNRHSAPFVPVSLVPLWPHPSAKKPDGLCEMKRAFCKATVLQLEDSCLWKCWIRRQCCKSKAGHRGAAFQMHFLCLWGVVFAYKNLAKVSYFHCSDFTYLLCVMKVQSSLFSFMEVLYSSSDLAFWGRDINDHCSSGYLKQNCFWWGILSADCKALSLHRLPLYFTHICAQHSVDVVPGYLKLCYLSDPCTSFCIRQQKNITKEYCKLFNSKYLLTPAHCNLHLLLSLWEWLSEKTYTHFKSCFKP